MELPRENKMGTEPIAGLILKMSLPMMVSMLVLAAYNVVDSIFVSRISEDALTAVSLVFSYQMLVMSVCVGTAVGVSSLIARRLGEKRREEADNAASQGFFLSLISGLFFLLLYGLLTPKLIGLFHPSETIYNHAVTYLYWVGVPCIFSMVQVMSEKVLQATGDTVASMVIQLVGAIFNLVFDPILIFGLLGFPALGVAGAAIATVGGQFVGMLTGFAYLRRRRAVITPHLRGFRPNKKIIGDIYRVGLPSIFLQAFVSVMSFGINKILYGFTPTAVSVFGVYFRLQSFIFMPVFGLNGGTMPIMAYNFGAKNRKRVTDALKYGCLYAVTIMAAGLLLFQVFPGWMLSLFDASEHMRSIGIPALRTISLCFPLAAPSIMASSLFQAVGNGKLSLMVSMLRQLVVLLPAAYLLSRLVGLSGIWWAFPLAEVLALVMSAYWVYRVYHRDILPLGDPIA